MHVDARSRPVRVPRARRRQGCELRDLNDGGVRDGMGQSGSSADVRRRTSTAVVRHDRKAFANAAPIPIVAGWPPHRLEPAAHSAVPRRERYHRTSTHDDATAARRADDASRNAAMTLSFALAGRHAALSAAPALCGVVRRDAARSRDPARREPAGPHRRIRLGRSLLCGARPARGLPARGWRRDRFDFHVCRRFGACGRC